MKKRNDFYLIGLVLIFLAIISGFLAWRAARNTHVVVEWTTASELGTAGFYLYRGLDEANITEQVNSTLIPASSNALEGDEYEYDDYDIEPGITYYYELEEVDNEGARVRFGPIQVRARRGGLIEAGMASIFALSGVVLLIWGWSLSSEPPQVLT